MTIPMTVCCGKSADSPIARVDAESEQPDCIARLVRARLKFDPCINQRDIESEIEVRSPAYTAATASAGYQSEKKNW